ncbi:hypothetical protein [Niallia sp. MER TA 168]|uniref:hypothetical protein n=1 Tax=Niallia sp. MER TA 168 TaxID=2939568 RepID=UPI00203B047B|nr:hypothetical protein [Niallia sp. MER TA 168]MCM3360909.1 hypothetical protein [Niallia sp. MER TA 168]
MDYQVMNNGIDGCLSNRGYEKLNEFIRILNKRNSEIDHKVASLFIKTTIAGVGLCQHKDSLIFPEIKELFDEYETELHQCGEQYKQIAKSFMNSYGLEDYLTIFTKTL